MFQAKIAASIQEGIDVQQTTLKTMAPAIATVAQSLSDTLKQGNKILLMGNGGSAAGAQHFAAELVGRFEAERRPFAAIALTTDTSVLTAIANDYRAEQIFSRQIEAVGKPGDLVIGFSTSGNSPNILEGAKAARAKGLTVVGLTGQSGGELVKYCDLILSVPSIRTARIQEVHALISHVLCEVVEQDLTEYAEGNPKLRSLDPKLGDADDKSGLDEKLRQLKLLILDFDGVLTDNRVLVTQDGTEGVLCHRGDGWGIARLKETGLEILVLSTELNPVVQARCRKLTIDCIYGCNNKLAALTELVNARSLSLEQVGYVGNDVNDLACMKQVGVPIAVADATSEIKDIACCVTVQRGGYGAVREVADLILNALTKRQPD